MELLKSDSKEVKYQEILVPALLSSTQEGQKPLNFTACLMPAIHHTDSHLQNSLKASRRKQGRLKRESKLTG